MKKFLIIPLCMIFGFIFTLSLSTIITLNFKPLYSFSINKFEIDKTSNLNKDELMENYNVLINYLTNPSIDKLEMPYFKSSKQGLIHFKDVKNIFTFIGKMLIFCFAILILLFLFVKSQLFKIITYMSIFNMCIISLSFAIYFIIPFNKLFTVFHELLFTNDYWIFNKSLDPVITVLPEEFFLLCFIFIVSLTFIISLIMFAISFKKPRDN